MTFPPHRIGRQRWEVRVGDPSTGFAARLQIRRDLEAVALPAFARAFDQMGLDEQVLHIPRLDLRIRVDSLAELNERLPEWIAEQVHQQLVEHLAHARSSHSRSENTPRLSTLQAHDDERLRNYLHKGWLAPLLSADESAGEITSLQGAAQRLASAWQVDPDAMASQSPVRFAQAVAFFYRLLHLLPDEQCIRWQTSLEAGAPRLNETERLALFRGLQRIHAAYATNSHLAREWRAMVFTVATIRELSAQELEVYIARVLGETSPSLSAFKMALGSPSVTAIAVTEQSLQQARAKDHRQVLDDFVKADGSSAQANHDFGSENSSQEPDDRLLAPIWALPTRQNSTSLSNWRVLAAGLVLTHPFIPALFSELGFVAADQRSLRASHLPRAAALLHWLAYARDELYEFEIGMCKVLLGLQLDDPLPVSQGLLSPQDHEECHALLTAMLSHWSALRSTSVDGLQSSFLQRPGLLRRSDNGWHLQLESAPFDMLLGHLPWGISIIKLPWMARPLFTDWPLP